MTGASDFAQVLRVHASRASSGSSSSIFGLRQVIDQLEFNPNSINHYWSLVRVDTSITSTQTAITKNFRPYVIYMFTPSTSGVRTFTHSLGSGFFELGSRTGAGTINYITDAMSSQSVSSFSFNVVAGRIYFLRATPWNVLAPVNMISGTVAMGSFRYLAIRSTTLRTYTFNSSFLIYNSAGVLMPFRVANRMEFQANQTYFVQGTGVISFTSVAGAVL